MQEEGGSEEQGRGGERTATMIRRGRGKDKGGQERGRVTLAMKNCIDMVVSANFIVLIYFLTTSSHWVLVVVTSITYVIISRLPPPPLCCRHTPLPQT
jgi:hypothetical protein